MKPPFVPAPTVPACRRLTQDWPRWVGLLLLGVQTGGAAELAVKAVNPLPISRSRQTLELTAAQLAGLGAADLRTVHVRDARGQAILCQAVDTDGDAYRKPDVVIFQADFAASETKTFTLVTGPKQVYTKDQFQAYGRFVRERFDDFAWENDRIAHRMYGKALETWAGEPLTSSTVDIWSKRTTRLVINDWYLTDDYHADHGEGADFYSAGPSRGCGGSGIWEAGRLWTSRNFVHSRVLANGPIRVLFELEYEPFEANGRKLREVKRISLDAGSQLDQFTSSYQWEGEAPGRPLVVGLGIKKTAGAVKNFSAEAGLLRVWEKMAKNAGMQGLAIAAPPAQVSGEAEDELNYLLLARSRDDLKLTYWAGFCWDKAGLLTNSAAWESHLANFARGLSAPVEVSITSR